MSDDSKNNPKSENTSSDRHVENHNSPAEKESLPVSVAETKQYIAQSQKDTNLVSYKKELQMLEDLLNHPELPGYEQKLAEFMKKIEEELKKQNPEKAGIYTEQLTRLLTKTQELSYGEDLSKLLELKGKGSDSYPDYQKRCQELSEKLERDLAAIKDEPNSKEHRQQLENIKKTLLDLDKPAAAEEVKLLRAQLAADPDPELKGASATRLLGAGDHKPLVLYDSADQLKNKSEEKTSAESAETKSDKEPPKSEKPIEKKTFTNDNFQQKSEEDHSGLHKRTDAKTGELLGTYETDKKGNVIKANYGGSDKSTTFTYDQEGLLSFKDPADGYEWKRQPGSKPPVFVSDEGQKRRTNVGVDKEGTLSYTEVNSQKKEVTYSLTIDSKTVIESSDGTVTVRDKQGHPTHIDTNLPDGSGKQQHLDIEYKDGKPTTVIRTVDGEKPQTLSVSSRDGHTLLRPGEKGIAGAIFYEGGALTIQDAQSHSMVAMKASGEVSTRAWVSGAKDAQLVSSGDLWFTSADNVKHTVLAQGKGEILQNPDGSKVTLDSNKHITKVEFVPEIGKPRESYEFNYDNSGKVQAYIHRKPDGTTESYSTQDGITWGGTGPTWKGSIEATVGGGVVKQVETPGPNKEVITTTPDGIEHKTTVPKNLSWDAAEQQKAEAKIASAGFDALKQTRELLDQLNTKNGNPEIEQKLRELFRNASPEVIQSMLRSADLDHYNLRELLNEKAHNKPPQLSEATYHILNREISKTADSQTADGIMAKAREALQAEPPSVRLQLFKEELTGDSPDKQKARTELFKALTFDELKQSLGTGGANDALDYLKQEYNRALPLSQQKGEAIVDLFEQLRKAHNNEQEASEIAQHLRIAYKSLKPEDIAELQKGGYNLEELAKNNKTLLTASTYGELLDSLQVPSDKTKGDKQADAGTVFKEKTEKLLRDAENALLSPDPKERLQMFKEAIAGASPEAVAARLRFKRDHADWKGYLHKSFPDSADYDQAREFVEKGELSPAKRIYQALGELDSRESVAAIVSHFTPEEQAEYLKGEAIVKSGRPTKDSDELRAAQMYKDTYAALEAASSHGLLDKQASIIAYSDSIEQGRETLLLDLAKADSVESMKSAISHMSKEDFDRLRENGGDNIFKQRMEYFAQQLKNAPGGSVLRDLLGAFENQSFDYPEARTRVGAPLINDQENRTTYDALTARVGAGGILEPVVSGLYGDAKPQAEQAAINLLVQLQKKEQDPVAQQKMISAYLDAVGTVDTNRRNTAEALNQAAEQAFNVIYTGMTIASVLGGPEATGAAVAGEAAARNAFEAGTKEALHFLFMTSLNGAAAYSNVAIKAAAEGDKYLNSDEYKKDLIEGHINVFMNVAPDAGALAMVFARLHVKGKSVPADYVTELSDAMKSGHPERVPGIVDRIPKLSVEEKAELKNGLDKVEHGLEKATQKGEKAVVKGDTAKGPVLFPEDDPAASLRAKNPNYEQAAQAYQIAEKALGSHAEGIAGSFARGEARTGSWEFTMPDGTVRKLTMKEAEVLDKLPLFADHDLDVLGEQFKNDYKKLHNLREEYLKAKGSFPSDLDIRVPKEMDLHSEHLEKLKQEIFDKTGILVEWTYPQETNASVSSTEAHSSHTGAAGKADTAASREHKVPSKEAESDKTSTADTAAAKSGVDKSAADGNKHADADNNLESVNESGNSKEYGRDSKGNFSPELLKALEQQAKIKDTQLPGLVNEVNKHYPEWKSAKEQIDNLNRELETAKQENNQSRVQELQTQVTNLREQLAGQMQKVANDYLSKSGIDPVVSQDTSGGLKLENPVKVSVDPNLPSNGRYAQGSGHLTINEARINDGPAALVSTMAHELHHFEQEQLVLSNIIEENGLDKLNPEDPATIKKLQELYEQSTNPNPSGLIAEHLSGLEDELDAPEKKPELLKDNVARLALEQYHARKQGDGDFHLSSADKAYARELADNLRQKHGRVASEYERYEDYLEKNTKLESQFTSSNEAVRQATLNGFLKMMEQNSSGIADIEKELKTKTDPAEREQLQKSLVKLKDVNRAYFGSEGVPEEITALIKAKKEGTLDPAKAQEQILEALREGQQAHKQALQVNHAWYKQTHELMADQVGARAAHKMNELTGRTTTQPRSDATNAPQTRRTTGDHGDAIESIDDPDHYSKSDKPAPPQFKPGDYAYLDNQQVRVLNPYSENAIVKYETGKAPDRGDVPQKLYDYDHLQPVIVGQFKYLVDDRGNFYQERKGPQRGDYYAQLIPEVRYAPREELRVSENTIDINRIKKDTAVLEHADEISAAKESGKSVDTVLAKAPVTESFLDPGISAFNSTGQKENCLACVSSVLKTIKDGHLSTVNDVYSTDVKGQELGQPTPGRFKNADQCMRYIADGSGVTLRPVPFESAETLPPGDYAVTFQLGDEAQKSRAERFDKDAGAGSSDQSFLADRHVVYAHKNVDGTMFVYDPQSGKRYSEKLVQQMLLQHPAFNKAEMP
jgi:hypothetical protein